MSHLIHFRNWKTLDCETELCSVEETAKPGCLILRFQKTPFYPASGGQPSDIGKAVIPLSSITLPVKEVTYSEDKQKVDHYVEVGTGFVTPLPGTKFNLFVDHSVRLWHSRLHSAGHVIDAALEVLKVALKPDKAYHYPDGPHICYLGEIGCPKDEFVRVVQEQCDRLIDADMKVFIDFANDDADDCTCERRMRIAGVISIPCGGTHVDSLKEIGKLVIRKIVLKSGRVRICYALEEN